MPHAFLAAGQHMRVKHELSIINNERNVDFGADANSGAPGGFDQREEHVAHFSVWSLSFCCRGLRWCDHLFQASDRELRPNLVFPACSGAEWSIV
jgi:hypothetical protein